MDDRIPAIGTKVRRRWIKLPGAPDASTLEPLLARLREMPRIVEAWLVAGRITPTDGKPPYETTDVALVLDLPLIGDPEAERTLMVELIAELSEVSPVAEGRHSWLFVSEAIMRAEEENAILLYARRP